MDLVSVSLALVLCADPDWIRVPKPDRIATSCADWSANHVAALKRRVSPELWPVVDEFYKSDEVVSSCTTRFLEGQKDCPRHLVDEDGKKVVTYSIDCFNEGAARMSDSLFQPVLASLVPMLIHGEAKLADRRAKEHPDDPVLEARAYRLRSMEQQYEEQRRNAPVVAALRQLSASVEHGAKVQAAATLGGAKMQAAATEQAASETADAIRQAGNRTSFCTSSRGVGGVVNTVCRPGY